MFKFKISIVIPAFNRPADYILRFILIISLSWLFPPLWKNQVQGLLLFLCGFPNSTSATRKKLKITKYTRNTGEVSIRRIGRMVLLLRIVLLNINSDVVTEETASFVMKMVFRTELCQGRFQVGSLVVTIWLETNQGQCKSSQGRQSGSRIVKKGIFFTWIAYQDISHSFAWKR